MHKALRVSTGKVQVIHVNVGPEGDRSATNLAGNLLRNGPDGPGYHWIFGDDDAIRIANDNELVYGAKGGTANAVGLHYCLIGYADQTESEWLDPYSLAAMDLCARQVGADARAKGIPVEHRAGVFSGQCGHRDVTLAFAVPGGHYDPGPNFPWDHFMNLVRKYAEIHLEKPKPIPPEDDDMKLINLWRDTRDQKVYLVVAWAWKKHIKTVTELDRTKWIIDTHGGDSNIYDESAEMIDSCRTVTQ